MTVPTFSQLSYQTHSQRFSCNIQAQQLLGIGEAGEAAELVTLMGQEQWQQIQTAAISSQAQFITINGNNYLCLGNTSDDTSGAAKLNWIISLQPHLQRQLEQGLHDSRLASVGQVMAGICHEVNQPLNAMRLRLYGLQQLATMGPIPDLDNHLKELDNQIERCANTLVNMRQLVGHQPISHSQFDLATSVSQIHKLLGSQLSQQGINLSLVGSHPTSPLFGQAQRFEQVLVNLINNARDAILEQAGTSRDNNKYKGEIQISLKHHQHNYQLDIIDNGPGIPEHLQEQVFTPYYTSKQAQGTGLGLALCRDLVNELDGSLQLDSQAGRTCFSITLPMPTGSATQAQ